jgi:hypothetical protein
MEEQLYVRVRGRVQGPYNREQLRGLARRGLFGRLHEVSEDGSQWVRASTIPDLFAAATESMNASDEPQAVEEAALPSPRGGAAEWWYLVNGQQFGPVDRDRLCELVGSRQLSRDTAVWTNGMAGWQPAAQVAALGISLSQPQVQAAPSEVAVAVVKGGVTVTDATYRALMGTRPWVLFMAVLLFIYAGLTALTAMFAFLEGNRTGSSERVAQGVGGFVGAALIVWMGMLLLRYSSRIAALQYSHDVTHLEQALDAQRLFWYLFGVIALVALVLAICVLIVALGVVI